MKIIKSQEQSQYLNQMKNEEIVTVQQNIGIKKLNKLKVSDLMIQDGFYNNEYKSLFDSLWWSALHELDMYTEGQDTEMTKRIATSTKKWLKEHQNLTIEFQDVTF